MAKPAPFHHAFTAKVDFAVGVAKQLGWPGVNSRPTLAVHIGVKPSTLKSACETGKVSDAVAGRFAEAFGFDVKESWWFDTTTTYAEKSSPAYRGRDTAGAFHAQISNRLGLVTPSTRILSSVPDLKRSMMANFAVDDAGQAAAEDTPSNLFFNVVLNPSLLAKVRYGFSTVLLRVLLPGKAKARLDKPIGRPPVMLGGAAVELVGTGVTPHWRLTVATGFLNGEYMTTDLPFAQLAGAKVGMKFKAELLVSREDGAIVYEGPAEDVTGAKEQILMALMSERLPEATAEADGWITLGIQELQLVRADAVP